MREASSNHVDCRALSYMHKAHFGKLRSNLSSFLQSQRLASSANFGGDVLAGHCAKHTSRAAQLVMTSQADHRPGVRSTCAFVLSALQWKRHRPVCVVSCHLHRPVRALSRHMHRPARAYSTDWCLQIALAPSMPREVESCKHKETKSQGICTDRPVASSTDRSV